MSKVAKILPEEVLQALTKACANGKQNQTAKRLGVSQTVVNQALHHKYPGDIAKLEQRIRGELMRATIQCPVLGQLSTKDCLDKQTSPLVFTNPQRVRLYKACRSCPQRNKKEGAE